MSLAGDERWELVQRIAASSTFNGSQALRSFLLYIAEQSLLGHTADIKEQVIGSNVLGRKPDYDPAGDNIVRVRARQLRQKLEQYFETEGTAEPLIVSIPKGGYVPVFADRPAVTETIAAIDVSPTLRKASQYPWIPWILAGLLGMVCAVLWLRLEQANASRVNIAPETKQLWSQIFAAKSGEPLLVLGDSGVALWQDMAHQNVTLSDYLGMRFLEGVSPDIGRWSEVARRRYTSLADVNLAARISRLGEAYGNNVRMRLARDINISDLGAGNAILLGSRRANPWVELFEQHLHYMWSYDDQNKRSFFRNREPRPGETDVLMSGTSDGGARRSYAVIAMLPNPTHNGKVVLIDGLSMDGTDAAGEFLLNADSSKLLLHEITAKLGGGSPVFEALLELTPVAGGSANSRLLEVRKPLQ